MSFGLKSLFATTLVTLALVTGTVHADPGYKTYFNHLDRAWAVGSIELFRPLTYRNGELLAFSGKFSEVTYAKHGRVSTVFLIDELKSGRTESRFKTEVAIYAPIGVLPQYTYWRENLPKTPHHTVLGGSRNIFTGDEVPKVRAVTESYVAGMKAKMPRKAELKMKAVVGALHSGIPRLRADAAQYLFHSGTQHKFMTDETDKRLRAFITDDSASDEKAGDDRRTVIDAAGKWNMERTAPALERLVAADGDLSGAALEALERLGKPRSGAQLLKLAAAKSVSVRVYVAGERAERAEELKAWDETKALVSSDAPVEIRQAAAAGLGRSGDAKAVALLATALDRGDAASRVAAAGLASIGSSAAVEALKYAVLKGPREARGGAVIGLSEVRECTACIEFLDEQFENHPDDDVRQLIRAVTLRPAKKH